jgi:hypothetical protein
MSVWPLLDLHVQAALGETDAGAYDTARYGQDTYGGSAVLPWVDINCDVIGMNITRSGTRDPVLTYRPEPGTLDLTLNDPGGRYDPADPSGPHYGALRPRLPVRVLVGSIPLVTVLADRVAHDPAAGRTTIVGTESAAVLASVTSPVVRPAESSLTRAQAIHAIGAAGSPLAPPLTVTGTGMQLKSAGLDGDIWTMLLATAQADRALVHADGSGALMYLADWDRVATSPVAHLGCVHQTAVDAHAWTWTTTVDTDMLVNTVTASSMGTDGLTDQSASASDPNSVQRYGASSGGADVVLPLAPAQLQDWADDAVRLGSWPSPRTDTLGIILQGTEPAAAAELAVWLALELADTIVWTAHNATDTQLSIVGVTHVIDDRGAYTGTLQLGKISGAVGYNDPATRYNQGAVYA